MIPIVPDMFLLLPHIVAVHCAWKGKPLVAGLWCGVAFLFHTKGLFVLAMCALLAWRALPVLALGFAIPNAAALCGLAATGALRPYFEQVWEWSTAYAGSSPELHPFANGLRRTADWLGFHVALVIGAATLWWQPQTRALLDGRVACALLRRRVAGARFFPRYYLQILPPMALMASPALARRKTLAWVAAVALLVPLVRFGPRYLTLAHDLATGRPHEWPDLALDQDSRAPRQS
ncbi:MAG: hypothetical protein WDO73_16375 [Ignavibacteriota bacterium]